MGTKIRKNAQSYIELWSLRWLREKLIAKIHTVVTAEVSKAGSTLRAAVIKIRSPSAYCSFPAAPSLFSFFLHSITFIVAGVDCVYEGTAGGLPESRREVT